MAEEIHTRIRRLIQEAGLKNVSVAKSLGVSAQTVSNWVRGENGVDPKHAIALAKLLRVSLGYLLGAEGASTQPTKNSIIPIDTHSGKPIPLMVLEELTVSNILNPAANVVHGKEIQFPHPTPPGSVAFSMQDQSMEPKIVAGDIVIIAHGNPLEPEKLVAAHIKSMGINVFRKFVFDGPDHCALVPLNTGHRTFRFTHAQWADDVELLGTYVGHWHTGE